MNTYEKGLWSEWRARIFLRLHGFHILHRRYITGKNTNRAEIDIIARRKNLVVFCEVKAHKNFQSAWDAITKAQEIRLRRAAETYLMRHRWHGDARFDVLIVRPWKMYWIKGAI